MRLLPLLVLLLLVLLATPRRVLAQTCTDDVAGWQIATWKTYSNPVVGTTFENTTDPDNEIRMFVYEDDVFVSYYYGEQVHTVLNPVGTISIRTTNDDGAVSFRMCVPEPTPTPTLAPTVEIPAVSGVWVTPTPRPTFAPGTVATAFASREPFASAGRGLALVSQLGTILQEPPPDECSAGLLESADDVVPWPGAGGSDLDIPTSADLGVVVCDLYDLWRPLFNIVRTMSLVSFVYGFFLYCRRRLLAFGQAGGE